MDAFKDWLDTDEGIVALNAGLNGHVEKAMRLAWEAGRLAPFRPPFPLNGDDMPPLPLVVDDAPGRVPFFEPPPVVSCEG